MSLPLSTIGTAALAAIGAGVLARSSTATGAVPGPLKQSSHAKDVGMASLLLSAAMMGAGWYFGGKRRSNSIGRGLMWAGGLNGLGAAALLTGVTKA